MSSKLTKKAQKTPAKKSQAPPARADSTVSGDKRKQRALAEDVLQEVEPPQKMAKREPPSVEPEPKGHQAASDPKHGGPPP